MTRKILYLTDSTEWGGAEEHMKFLAMSIDTRSFSANVAIPKAESTGEFVDEIRERGVRIHHLRMVPLNLRDVNILRNTFYFCRCLLRERPDLIHFVLPWPTRDIWCGMLAAMLLRIKFLVDFQLVPPTIQYPPSTWSILKFLREILTFLFNRADRLICVSKGNKNRLIQFFDLKEERIRVIYNGVDLERFERPDRQRAEGLRKKLGISPDQIVVTTVARLNIQKGHEYLIKAARQVASNTENLVFLLVGSGELHQSLERLVQEFGLKKRFIFAGYRKEIPEILSFTDIFVLSTLFEGFPHAVLEAMAAGCCVVSSRVDGVEEVVCHRETGLLVDPGDVDQLAKALKSLVANRDKREQMGLKGRERVKDFFDIRRMLALTHEMYHDILSQ